MTASVRVLSTAMHVKEVDNFHWTEYQGFSFNFMLSLSVIEQPSMFIQVFHLPHKQIFSRIAHYLQRMQVPP